MLGTYKKVRPSWLQYNSNANKLLQVGGAGSLCTGVQQCFRAVPTCCDQDSFHARPVY